MLEKKLKNYACPAEFTLDMIGGKWKIVIIWYLDEQKIMRYGEIKKVMEGITHKMLSQQLKELESDGLILRKEYHQVPPKVEYSLTSKGEDIRPIIDAMVYWGKKYIG